MRGGGGASCESFTDCAIRPATGSSCGTETTSPAIIGLIGAGVAQGVPPAGPPVIVPPHRPPQRQFLTASARDRIIVVDRRSTGPRWSLSRGNGVVPSLWRTTGVAPVAVSAPSPRHDTGSGRLFTEEGDVVPDPVGALAVLLQLHRAHNEMRRVADLAPADQLAVLEAQLAAHRGDPHLGASRAGGPPSQIIPRPGPSQRTGSWQGLLEGGLASTGGTAPGWPAVERGRLGPTTACRRCCRSDWPLIQPPSSEQKRPPGWRNRRVGRRGAAAWGSSE